MARLTLIGKRRTVASTMPVGRSAKQLSLASRLTASVRALDPLSNWRAVVRRERRETPKKSKSKHRLRIAK